MLAQYGATREAVPRPDGRADFFAHDLARGRRGVARVLRPRPPAREDARAPRRRHADRHRGRLHLPVRRRAAHHRPLRHPARRHRGGAAAAGRGAARRRARDARGRAHRRSPAQREPRPRHRQRAARPGVRDRRATAATWRSSPRTAPAVPRRARTCSAAPFDDVLPGRSRELLLDVVRQDGRDRRRVRPSSTRSTCCRARGGSRAARRCCDPSPGPAARRRHRARHHRPQARRRARESERLPARGLRRGPPLRRDPGPLRGDAAGVPRDRARGRHRFVGAAARRDRHRQGADRARDSSRQPPAARP